MELIPEPDWPDNATAKALNNLIALGHKQSLDRHNWTLTERVGDKNGENPNISIRSCGFAR
jgi:hypothetical protein